MTVKRRAGPRERRLASEAAFGLQTCRVVWRARKPGALILALLFQGLFSHTASAAPAPDPTRAGEVIQRQQQESIQQDQERILSGPRTQTTIDVPTHKTSVAPAGSCRTINAIEFVAATHMKLKWRARLTKPYLNRCLGLGDVENLLSDITRYYIDRGNPTTRVYVKPQSLREGVLVLQIVEGRVERVTLKDGGGHSISLATAFGNINGSSFNLRTFEEGLDQINRLQSNHATLDILPGDNPGDSIVEIKNVKTTPLHVTLSYDDTGQKSTGINQASATGVYDDLLGLNDQISYTRRQTIKDGRPNTDSHSNSVLFTVPYNAATLTLGYSNSDYTSQSKTLSGTVLVLTGTTINTFGRIDAEAWRDSRSKLNVYATLTRKEDKNYVDDAFLSVSSRILSVLDLGTDFTTIIGDGSLKVGAEYSQGITGLGALHDTGVLNDNTPRAQFHKLSANAYLNLPFRIAKMSWTVTSDVEGQYAFDPLFSSEQIVVGSPYTVRGFQAGSLINDRGVYARNEVSTQIPVHLFKQYPAAIRPYVGLDGGYVSGVASNTPHGFIAGAAVGAGLLMGPVTVDLYTSHEISHAALKNEGFLTFLRVSFKVWG